MFFCVFVRMCSSPRASCFLLHATCSLPYSRCPSLLGRPSLPPTAPASSPIPYLKPRRSPSHPVRTVLVHHHPHYDGIVVGAFPGGRPRKGLRRGRASSSLYHSFLHVFPQSVLYFSTVALGHDRYSHCQWQLHRLRSAVAALQFFIKPSSVPSNDGTHCNIGHTGAKAYRGERWPR